MTEVPQHSRAAFGFVMVTVMLDMLALGLMIPVLPKLLVQFEGGDVASAAKVTGVFGFFWALMQFVSMPILGALSDRYGRRPVILLSNLGMGLDYVLMALAPSLGWLFVGRLLSGVTSATVSTAMAYVADVTAPEQRAGRFGMIGASFGFGFVIGPAVGGVLGGYDLRLPFWVAASLSLLNACYGAFVLPESLPPDRRTTAIRASWPLLSLGILLQPGRIGLTLVSTLGSLAHDALPSVFVLYASTRYGWQEREVGLVMACVGVSTAVVSAVLVRPVVRALGERRTVLVALLCGAGGFFTYGAASTGAMFLAGIPLVALWGMSGPSVQAILSRSVDATEQGQLQGAIGSLRGLTGLVGPLLFTQVFAAAITTVPGAPYLLASGLLLVAFAVAWVVAHPGTPASA